MKRLRLCAATRHPESTFWSETLLGQSLRRFPEELRPELVLGFDNQGERRQGLPALYNRWLAECPSDRHLLLIHDDVYLHDPLLEPQLALALERADVVGLAGSRGAPPAAVSWGLHFDAEMKYGGWMISKDFESVKLSGAVSHETRGSAALRTHEPPPVHLGVYGPTPMDCDLLDGVFLALDVDAVRTARVGFDERFSFHLYDIDFCRSARIRQLLLSTWPILITHGSGGAFGTPDWCEAARAYRRKWACA